MDLFETDMIDSLAFVESLSHMSRILLEISIGDLEEFDQPTLANALNSPMDKESHVSVGPYCSLLAIYRPAFHQEFEHTRLFGLPSLGPLMRVEKSSHIRPFAKDDIPAVADLYQRVYLPAYSGARSVLLASLERYFEELFFAELWQDEPISPLVCTDAQGRLAGFVGTIPRRMIFKARPILLANSFHFMADPNSQVLAGVQLLKALFSGRRI